MERRLIYSISYTLKVDNRCRVSVCWPYRVVIISISGFLNSFVNKKDPKLWEKSLLDTSWAPGLPRFSRGLTVGIGPSYRLCLFLNPESARAGKINKYPHGQHVLLFSLLIFPPPIFLNETQKYEMQQNYRILGQWILSTWTMEEKYNGMLYSSIYF